MLIQLTDINNNTFYLHEKAIARITKAGTSQAWHGINTNIQTFDNNWIEVKEKIEEIIKQMNTVNSIG